VRPARRGEQPLACPAAVAGPPFSGNLCPSLGFIFFFTPATAAGHGEGLFARVLGALHVSLDQDGRHRLGASSDVDGSKHPGPTARRRGALEKKKKQARASRPTTPWGDFPRRLLARSFHLCDRPRRGPPWGALATAGQAPRVAELRGVDGTRSRLRGEARTADRPDAVGRRQRGTATPGSGAGSARRGIEAVIPPAATSPRAPLDPGPKYRGPQTRWCWRRLHRLAQGLPAVSRHAYEKARHPLPRGRHTRHDPALSQAPRFRQTET